MSKHKKRGQTLFIHIQGLGLPAQKDERNARAVKQREHQL
jgi:hypothetical protein